MTSACHQDLPLSKRNNYDFSFSTNELMVKWSTYNIKAARLQSTFDSLCPNCLFVRVLRVSRGLKNKQLTPGKVALIKRGVGEKLEGWSLIERVDHFIIREQDVLLFGDLD